MKANTKVGIGVVGLIILAAIMVNVSDAPAPKLNTLNYDEFAKCLTSNNAVFYGASWCPHCQTQKKAFGSSVKYLTYVECSTPDGRSQTEVCRKAGITGYPTWKFNEKDVQGELDFQQLSKNSGCSLGLII